MLKKLYLKSVYGFYRVKFEMKFWSNFEINIFIIKKVKRVMWYVILDEFDNFFEFFLFLN